MESLTRDVNRKVGVVVQSSSQETDTKQDVRNQKRQALEMLRSDLLGIPQTKPDVTNQGNNSNSVVVISGVPRRIRHDTKDHERLNALVRDLRYSDLNAKNQEINRQSKLATVSREVRDLNMERMKFSWQVPSWQHQTWRSVNIEQKRVHPDDPLHYVAPERRIGALRVIEQNMAMWPQTARKKDALNSSGQAIATVPAPAPAPAVLPPPATPHALEQEEVLSCDSRLSCTQASPTSRNSSLSMSRQVSPKPSPRGKQLISPKAIQKMMCR